MNRLAKCIKFQFVNTTKSTVGFLGIYTAISLALLIMFLNLNDSNSNGSISSGFYIGGSVYAFVYVIANYKAMFNYLLIFGNTRKNIFLSSAITSIMLSILLSVVSILSLFIENVLSKVFLYNNSANLLSLIYNSSNYASEFLWFTAFFIMICSFSMLYGSLAYKFGKVFVTVFWVGFGVSWMVLPIISGMNNVSIFITALKTFFCIGVTNGILLSPVNFIITAMIINAAAYVISRRQSQIA